MPSPCRALIMLILLLLSCTPATATRFVAGADRQAVDLAEVVGQIAGADVIFIGEAHDNPQHHRTQLDLLQALHARNVPLAIGVEMFASDDQPALDAWVGGTLDEAGFQAVYARNWSYGWPLYRELFRFAREHRIPLLALNIPKPLLARFSAEGVAALPAGERPPHLSLTLNATQAHYMSAIARQVFGGNAPEPLVARLGAAQALRNHWLAWQVARFRAGHAATKVVVLSGTWHAVKSGVPALLPAYGPLTCKVLLPELPEFTQGTASIAETDYLFMP